MQERSGLMSDAQSRASMKWNRSRDNITIRPTKEDGAKIRSAAKDAGLSVQQFILLKLKDVIECQSTP